MSKPITIAADYWKPPFRYCAESTRIMDANGNMILDVRGWGYLTGQGSLGLSIELATAIQDDLGTGIVTMLNASWPKATE